MVENGNSKAIATSKSYASLVRIDKVLLIYRQSPLALLISIPVAGLWVALMWGVAEQGALLAWVAVISISTLIRFVLFASYSRCKPAGEQVLRWEQPFTLSLIPLVITWGVGCVLVMPASSLLHQVITFMFLIGMSAMAVSAYGILPRLAMLVIHILVVPISVAFLLQGGWTQVLIAASGVISLIAVSRSVFVHGAALFESFHLRHELQDAYRISDLHANTDSLTGVLNRRAFLGRSEKSLGECVLQGKPATMLMLDVDDFKKINDLYGHAAGDAALRQVVLVLQSCFRSTDQCGRIGGDEFAIFLPDTSFSQAKMLSGQLLHVIAGCPFRVDSQEFTISVSVGLASDSISIEDLLHRADSAMYAAKRKGKNQIAEFDSMPVAS